jgi:hypothetical protein
MIVFQSSFCLERLRLARGGEDDEEEDNESGEPKDEYGCNPELFKNRIHSKKLKKLLPSRSCCKVKTKGVTPPT